MFSFNTFINQTLSNSEKLLQVNFNKCDKNEIIALIKTMKTDMIDYERLTANVIKGMKIRRLLSKGYDSNQAKLQVESEMKMNKDTEKQINTFVSLRNKYNNWRIAEPEEIYNTLKSVASKNKDGKLSKENLKELKGNTIVWDFLCMIINYLGMQVGLVSEEKYQTSQNRLNTGKFIKRSYIEGIDF